MRSLQTAAARGCDMLDKESVIKKVNHLLNSQSGRKSKYQRNYNLYVGSMSSDIDSAAPSILGFMPANYSSTLENDTPKFNVIKSAIDSVVSKISQARCRPFVNCNMGSHKTFMIARNLQSFLDSYCDVQALNKKVAAILRDAMIFDTGYLFFNADSVEWLRALPWDVYLDPQEVSGNGSELKNLYIEFRNFPLDQLDEDTKKLLTDDERERTYIIYSLYFNANTETKAIFINRRIKKIEKGYRKIPLIIFHYCEPLVGSSAISVADMLCGIQEQIDILLKKISEASRLSVANNYFVPKSLGVSASRLNNRIGNVIPINSAAEDIQVFNPEFINPQYMELLNDLIERAYNLVGVSQLSSQGKKETGITSGIAISTMESLENDRFELELHQYIDCFTNICKTMIEVMGTSDKYKKDTLMAKSRYTYETTWESVKEETAKLKLMFSSADLLSKDPNEKLKQCFCRCQKSGSSWSSLTYRADSALSATRKTRARPSSIKRCIKTIMRYPTTSLCSSSRKTFRTRRCFCARPRERETATRRTSTSCKSSTRKPTKSTRSWKRCSREMRNRARRPHKARISPATPRSRSKLSRMQEWRTNTRA